MEQILPVSSNSDPPFDDSDSDPMQPSSEHTLSRKDTLRVTCCAWVSNTDSRLVKQNVQCMALDEILMGILSLVDHITDSLLLITWATQGSTSTSIIVCSSISIILTMILPIPLHFNDPLMCLAFITGFGMLGLIYRAHQEYGDYLRNLSDKQNSRREHKFLVDLCHANFPTEKRNLLRLLGEIMMRNEREITNEEIERNIFHIDHFYTILEDVDRHLVKPTDKYGNELKAEDWYHALAASQVYEIWKAIIDMTGRELFVKGLVSTAPVSTRKRRYSDQFKFKQKQDLFFSRKQLDQRWYAISKTSPQELFGAHQHGTQPSMKMKQRVEFETAKQLIDRTFYECYNFWKLANYSGVSKLYPHMNAFMNELVDHPDVNLGGNEDFVDEYSQHLNDWIRLDLTEFTEIYDELDHDSEYQLEELEKKRPSIGFDKVAKTLNAIFEKHYKSVSSEILLIQKPKMYKLLESTLESIPQLIFQFYVLFSKSTDPPSWKGNEVLILSLFSTSISHAYGSAKLLLPTFFYEHLAIMVFTLLDTFLRCFTIILYFLNTEPGVPRRISILSYLVVCLIFFGLFVRRHGWTDENLTLTIWMYQAPIYTLVFAISATTGIFVASVCFEMPHETLSLFLLVEELFRYAICVIIIASTTAANTAYSWLVYITCGSWILLVIFSFLRRKLNLVQKLQPNNLLKVAYTVIKDYLRLVARIVLGFTALPIQATDLNVTDDTSPWFLAFQIIGSICCLVLNLLLVATFSIRPPLIKFYLRWTIFTVILLNNLNIAGINKTGKFPLGFWLFQLSMLTLIMVTVLFYQSDEVEQVSQSLCEAFWILYSLWLVCYLAMLPPRDKPRDVLISLFISGIAWVLFFVVAYCMYYILFP